MFEILENKWWVLSKEEERRRGSGLRKIHVRERERERENVGERKISELKKWVTKTRGQSGGNLKKISGKSEKF